ncbi:AMP-binding protein [Nocardioides daejeonensis]|uniref:AMP-binding protein n=1 Tax=Nocardioides daejeonensis TaxID=1046556 RepID=UPI0013A5AC13|nr:AMP-binding protein [Nocardioides daejeonensis]
MPFSALTIPAASLPDLLGQAAHATPHQDYLRFAERTLTYQGLHTSAARICGGFQALGVRPGDRVALLVDNCPEFVEAVFGILSLGAVVVPINTANRGTFLRHQLNDSGSVCIVVAPEHLERVQEIREELTTVTSVVVIGEAGDTTIAFEDLRAGEPVARSARPEDLAFILYTSGTTGASKGCMLSHRYLQHAGASLIDSIQREPHEVQFSTLPLFHMHAMTAGVVATLLLHGTSVIGTRFSLSRFWDQIEESKASICYVIGPMATLVAEGPDSPAAQRAYGQLRLVRGAPFTPEATRAWRERFGVAEARAGGYGMTEASPVVTMPRGVEAPAGSSGRVGDGFEMRIVDSSGAEVPPGVQGEITVRPREPHIMFEGYWGRPEATAERWQGEWFHTGDLGSVDADGWFSFGDRLKDCLRRRGENISSVEIEDALLEHPDLAEVAVHAVPSPLTEDDLKVTAVLRPGSSLVASELWEFARSRVPDFAQPRYIEFRSELPRNTIGRVQKFELRNDGVTATTWDAETAKVVPTAR